MLGVFKKYRTLIVLLIIILISALIIGSNTKKESERVIARLWDNITYGDVSSARCAKAVTNYSNYDSVYGGPILSDHLYIYTKHRCLGVLTENQYDIFSHKISGTYDRVVDLITEYVIVACVRSYNPEGIDCYDNIESWSYPKQEIPPIYPIYMNAWLQLKGIAVKNQM